MRHDESTITAPTESPDTGSLPSRSFIPARADDAPPPVPPGARPLKAWAWPLATGSLVAATCLTLAAFASVWLVPPYLALMVWVLGFPRALRGDARALAGSWTRAIQNLRDRRAGAIRDGGLDRDDRPDAATDSDSELPETGDRGTGLDAPAEDVEVEDGLSPSPAPILAKAKRGKGRGRKAKSTQAAEAGNGQAAIWVCVGPGKFVRADAASVESAPGPAAAEGVPGVENEEAGGEETAGLEVGPGLDLAGEDDGGREPGPRPDGWSVEDSEGDNGNAPDAPFESEDASAARAPEAAPALDLDPRPEPSADSFEDAEASAAAGPPPQGGPRPSGMGVAERAARGVRIRLSRALGRVRRRGTSAPRFGRPGTRRPPAGRPPRRRYVRRSGRAERSHPPRSPPSADRHALRALQKGRPAVARRMGRPFSGFREGFSRGLHRSRPRSGRKITVPPYEGGIQGGSSRQAPAGVIPTPPAPFVRGGGKRSPCIELAGECSGSRLDARSPQNADFATLACGFGGG